MSSKVQNTWEVSKIRIYVLNNKGSEPWANMIQEIPSLLNCSEFRRLRVYGCFLVSRVYGVGGAHIPVIAPDNDECYYGVTLYTRP